MLICYDHQVVNLNAVVGFFKYNEKLHTDTQGFFIEFESACNGQKMCFKTEEERDEIFYLILDSYENGEKIFQVEDHIK